MILTWENLTTWIKMYPSATYPTTSPTWTCLGLNPVLRGETPATNNGTANFSSVRIFAKAPYKLRRSVRLSACISEAPTDKISVKFDTGDSFMKMF